MMKSILFIFFFVLTIIAEKPNPDYVWCSTNTYTHGSIFSYNLNHALTNLLKTSNGQGFFKISHETGKDTVHAYALCLPDIGETLCQHCVRMVTQYVTTGCPNRRGATVISQDCLITYYNTVENKTVGYVIEDDRVAPQPELVKKEARSFLYSLVEDAAAGGTHLKYSSGNQTKPGSVTVYARVQCRPDLSSVDCFDCLVNAISSFYVLQESWIGERLGGGMIRPTCGFQYNTSPFFKETIQNISPPHPTTKGKSSKMLALIVAFVVTVVTIIGVAAISVFFIMRKKAHPRPQTIGDTPDIVDVAMDFSMVRSVPYFSFDSLKAVTNDFSEKNVLGKGGFGSVYKGTWGNGQEIAVKRLKVGSSRVEVDFQNEIKALNNIRHRNVVHLHGLCTERGERILVFEFVPNGSLDKYIFERKEILDWQKRRGIIVDITIGLHYLHQGSPQSVIHRDFKAANILLDASWKAKIADFGLARLLSQDETHRETQDDAATRGYIPPETYYHKRYSAKSDVYNYGIVVLEIIAGRRSPPRENSNEKILFELAYESLVNGTIRGMIDPSLIIEPDTETVEEIKRCVHIALLCLHGNHESRPSMNAVMDWIRNSDKPLPPVVQEPGPSSAEAFPDTPVFDLKSLYLDEM